MHVTVDGITKTSTHKTKAEAEAWAVRMREEMRALSGGVSLTHTVKDALERYARDVSPKKKGVQWELRRLAAFGRDPLADVKLCTVKPPDIAEWRDRRLKEVSGSTVNRELNLLSNVFAIARDEWGWIAESPTRKVRRPKESAPRDRLISQKEAEYILVALGYSPELDTIESRVGRAFLFALETAMRAGEICALEAHSVKGRVARLEDSKNGSRRDVPLSARAVEIWEEAGGKGFGLISSQIDANFRKAKKRAGIADITFHDTRHTAITRLAKRIDVLALARMTGHKDIKQLMTYYNETAEEVAKLLD